VDDLLGAGEEGEAGVVRVDEGGIFLRRLQIQPLGAPVSVDAGVEDLVPVTGGFPLPEQNTRVGTTALFTGVGRDGGNTEKEDVALTSGSWMLVVMLFPWHK